MKNLLLPLCMLLWIAFDWLTMYFNVQTDLGRDIAWGDWRVDVCFALSLVFTALTVRMLVKK